VAGSGFVYPECVAEMLARDVDDAYRRWAAHLPEAVTVAAARWEVELGEPFQPGGQCSWVAPALRADGEEVVLKVGYLHDDGAHEAEGLAMWDGDGVVRLLGHHKEGDIAELLLERCRPGTSLGRLPEPEQDVVIAGLLRRLWREPPDGHPYRSLQAMCDAWAAESEARPCGLDPGVRRDGLALYRNLPSTAARSCVILTDLHESNVLAAEREAWLVVDPKPHVGDPTYDLIQPMFQYRRLHEDPVRFSHRMAELTGLDRDRTVQWLFARCVQEAPENKELHDLAERLARVI
jgi:streptomycin 6-kinase